MDKISRELDPGLAKVYGNVQNYYNKQRKLKSFENQKAELENLNEVNLIIFQILQNLIAP